MIDKESYQLIIAAFEGETAGVEAVGRLLEAYRGDSAAMPAAASIAI